MIETYKQLIANQYEAVFCTLDQCLRLCPDDNWNGSVGNLKFCQVAFHTLFYADVYLGQNYDSLRDQGFHKQHADDFGDYEEDQDRPQKLLYAREFVEAYLAHCRGKAMAVIAGETEDTLKKTPGFDWLKFSRAEVHVYNIRHIHHHVAQLSLRLRLDADINVPWVGSGWKEFE